MKWQVLDTHCDTISESFDRGTHLGRNELHIDLERMAAYASYTQFFACFIDPRYKSRALARCLELIDYFHQEIGRREEVQFCTSAAELHQKPISAFLSLEGGEPIDSLETLRMLYRLGVRCAALTWNHSNHIAAGVLEQDAARGLTAFGKTVVAEMERLGMLVDVSHLNERSFWDIAALAKKPFIASHSNARALCGHPRNLTDAQFLHVVKTGGCVGINLYPLFLSDSGRADIAAVVAHIEHFMALGGGENIGIGADFDGVDALPEEICGVQDVGRIFDALLQRGYSEEAVWKIAYKNFERVLQICL